MAITWNWVVERFMFYFTPSTVTVFIKVLPYSLVKRTRTGDPSVNIYGIFCLTVCNIVA